LPRGKSRKSLEGLFVGVDPGKNGGLAVIDERRRVVFSSPMGQDEKALEENFSAILNIFHKEQERNPDIFITAVMELVHSMPQQSAQSGFTFGEWFGMAKILIKRVCRISTRMVPPQEWMKGVGIPNKKMDHAARKKRNRAEAINLFPKAEEWDRSMKYQLAVADAFLMAEYARILFVKE